MAFAQSRLDNYHTAENGSKPRNSEERLKQCLHHMRSKRSRLVHQARMKQPEAAAQLRLELRTALTATASATVSRPSALRASSSVTSASVVTEPATDSDAEALAEEDVDLLVAQCLADLDISLQHQEQALLRQYEDHLRHEADELAYLASIADDMPEPRPAGAFGSLGSSFGRMPPASSAIHRAAAITAPVACLPAFTSSSSGASASSASATARFPTAAMPGATAAAASASHRWAPSGRFSSAAALHTPPPVSAYSSSVGSASGPVIPLRMQCPACGATGCIRAVGNVVICSSSVTGVQGPSIGGLGAPTPFPSTAVIAASSASASSSSSSSSCSAAAVAGSGIAVSATGCGFRFNMSGGISPAHLPTAIAAAGARHRTASPTCMMVPPCQVEGGFGASSLVMRCPSCKFVDIIA